MNKEIDEILNSILGEEDAAVETAVRHKTCSVCGAEFQPDNNYQRICPECRSMKKHVHGEPKNRKEPEPAPTERGTLLCMDDAMNAFTALSADVASLAMRMRTSEQAVLEILGDLAAVKDKIKGRTKA